MDNWLLYVLIAVGALLVVAAILYFSGNKKAAMKVLLPFTAIVALVALVMKVFGGGASAIEKENDRIKKELKEIQAECDKLKNEVATETVKFNNDKKVLEDKIKASDDRAEQLKKDIAEMQKGFADWFNNLPEDKKTDLMNSVDLPPGLPSDFLNP